MRGLTQKALNRRLDPTSERPIAVAFSGGGDSLALLLAAKAWGEAHDRPVLALTVDHGLQVASLEWTERCRKTAERLGVGFQALSWTGDKPRTGLPAAARAARHALLADAARKAGAKVLLVGHTADDLLEAAAMRAEGSTVPDPREWAPSPVWPQGRDIFLLRPLLKVRRAALRDWLTAQGESWIEDPANDDPRFARTRARQSLSDNADSSDVAASGPRPRGNRRWREAAGVLSTGRGAFTPAEVAAACLCAAGTARPPRGERTARLAQRLNAGEAFTATLAGTRVEADKKGVRFMRDAGEIARGGLAPIRLTPGESAVWDGRFELVADRPVAVSALKGYAAKLPRAENAALAAVPPAARPGLPAIVEPSGAVHCPVVAAEPQIQARPLALTRYRAAMGFIKKEAQA